MEHRLKSWEVDDPSGPAHRPRPQARPTGPASHRTPPPHRPKALPIVMRGFGGQLDLPANSSYFTDRSTEARGLSCRTQSPAGHKALQA